MKGFFSTLDTILGKKEKEEAKQREEAKASPNNSKRDQLVPIYMYCKNLWDKWLIHPVGEGKDYNTNPYTVDKFFKNFLFIDSFYRNIYNLLPVNCQKFMNIFDSLATNDTRDSKSLYSFIGDLAKECNCLFVAVPDYINLGTVDNDGKMHKEGLENMSKIFRCIPHNEMRHIQTDNKFIVIYTHEPSKNQDDKKGFVNDTINICDSDGNVTDEALQLFGGVSTPKDVDGTTKPKQLDNMTASAYPVPSFAVSFSGHNNHIFKGVDVNMDNPIATEHSINILSYIAQMGSGNGQKVAYQGQDVFPIFSNYAYQSTVTMMGNVQIQPLMYYQLMNIPMWKGAYMIFNVKHSITPGNMTTTFTGMKMSKNCVPFLDKWVYPVECVIPPPPAVSAPPVDGGGAQTVSGIDTTGVNMVTMTGGAKRKVKSTQSGPVSDVAIPNCRRNPGTGQILSNQSAASFIAKITELFNQYPVAYTRGGSKIDIIIKDGKWYTDCSGAPWQVYNELYKINIGYPSSTQWDSDKGLVVDINNSLIVQSGGKCDGVGRDGEASKPNLDVLLPGDLLFYSNPPDHWGRNYNICHVEIYLGNGMIIGAGQAGMRKKKSALSYGYNYGKKFYIGAKRFVYGK